MSRQFVDEEGPVGLEGVGKEAGILAGDWRCLPSLASRVEKLVGVPLPPLVGDEID
jgi:hypothetical protein